MADRVTETYEEDTEMKRIHYAGTSFVTGDAIARALIAYARVLTDNRSSDVVEVPISRRDGSPGRVELLIVPTNGMLFETEPTLVRDVIDESLILELHGRADRLTREDAQTIEWQQQTDAPLYSDVHSFA